MHRLKIVVAHKLIAEWPVPCDVYIPTLARALWECVQTLRRIGPVAAWIENGNAAHIIGKWS